MKKHTLRLRGQMMLVYLLGGALPILLILLVLLNSQRAAMLDLARSTSETELMMLKNTLDNECSVLRDISRRMYFDSELEEIARTQYRSYADVVDTFRTYTALDQFEDSYSADIASITVYLENPTLAGNSQLARADETVCSSEWYSAARKDNGRARWWYIRDPADGINYLTLVRQLRTQEGKSIGVAALRMNPQPLQMQFSERKADTYLLLDDGTMALKKENGDTPAELPELAQQYMEQPGSYRVSLGGQTCLLTVQTLSDPSYCNDMVLLSVQPYDVILTSVYQNMRSTILIAALGAVMAVSGVLLFSLYFSRRVARFRCEMEKAARGERTLAQSLGGGDEISDLYTYLNSMIHDIDTLTAGIYETKLEQEQARSRQREAEFKMLASQINPHFLFNTLETIRMKAYSCGDTEVADMVKILAKLMRHSIEVRDSLVTVKSELALTEYYLKLQHYRFGDVVTYTVKAEPGSGELYILPLLIQPLVENAFVHGLKERRSGGHIAVQAAANAEELTITVTDNGVGMSEAALEALMQSIESDQFDHTHIGVANIHHRIRLYYGAGWGISIQSTVGTGTTVTLRLPRCESENYTLVDKKEAIL